MKIKILIIFISLQFTLYAQSADSITKDTTSILQNKVENKEKSLNTINDNIKAWLPLITLIISSVIIFYKIDRDTKEGIKKEIAIAKIKLERDRLEKFYDPILTLLKANSAIFNAYGPKSVTKDNEYEVKEASDIWEGIVHNVTIPNNTKICDKITDFSHLIIEDDSIDPYLNYLIHAQSFKHFKNSPNSIHKAFKYPTDITAHVNKNRNNLLSKLSSIEEGLKISNSTKKN